MRAFVSSAGMNKDIEDARKIYIDSNIVIYFVEGAKVFRDKAIEFFQYAELKGIDIVTSEISISECLYGAYKRENDEISEKYREIFYDIDMFQLVPIEREIVEGAAKIGARNTLKLIDAIHLTSALDTECDVLITNDRGIRSTENLKVVQMLEM